MALCQIKGTTFEKMDGDVKRTVTNNHLLCKIKRYNGWIRSICQMTGGTFEYTIVPEAERFHTFCFHICSYNNNCIDALKEEFNEILWVQQSTHK